MHSSESRPLPRRKNNVGSFSGFRPQACVSWPRSWQWRWMVVVGGWPLVSYDATVTETAAVPVSRKCTWENTLLWFSCGAEPDFTSLAAPKASVEPDLSGIPQCHDTNCSGCGILFLLRVVTQPDSWTPGDGLSGCQASWQQLSPALRLCFWTGEWLNLPWARSRLLGWCAQCDSELGTYIH